MSGGGGKVVRGFLFFCSSRRRHTRWPRDWSSDVCSSDLVVLMGSGRHEILERVKTMETTFTGRCRLLDRKSTRLNSSHVAISYAVFCLKKKKNKYNVYLYKKKKYRITKVRG